MAIDRAEISNCCCVCSVSRFALSWFWSAATRLLAPVCSVLIMLVVNVCRVPMTPELVPNVSVWVCTFEMAVLIELATFVSSLVSMKEPTAEPLIEDRPSPEELKLTPSIVSELVPVGLKSIVRLSPPRRFTPLYDASEAS